MNSISQLARNYALTLETARQRALAKREAADRFDEADKANTAAVNALKEAVIERGYRGGDVDRTMSLLLAIAQEQIVPPFPAALSWTPVPAITREPEFNPQASYDSAAQCEANAKAMHEYSVVYGNGSKTFTERFTPGYLERCADTAANIGQYAQAVAYLLAAIVRQREHTSAGTSSAWHDVLTERAAQVAKYGYRSDDARDVGQLARMAFERIVTGQHVQASALMLAELEKQLRKAAK